jgi:hypothetical protein
MRTLLLVTGFGLVSLQVFAQAPDSRPASPAHSHGAAAAETSLATPAGNEVSVYFGSYTYTEPGETSISIHGPKVGGEYTGTLSLGERGHWFTQANLRATTGNTTYDGWCFPFLIRPNSGSPNGYELDLGDPSPCSESGDSDWYVEARWMVGKDLIGDRWGVSPHGGLGFRHLSNGTTGIPGFRTDDYLYLPLGITARTRVAPHRTLSFDVEYDQLLHGWQTTRDSKLGGGDVPATATAPGFTIDGFTDVSFAQHGGWALRASAKFQLTRRWSVEPSYIYWSVGDSTVSYETVTFTVNNVTASEQWGAYEPRNTTREFGVRVGFGF